MIKNKKIITSILFTILPIIYIIFSYNILPEMIPTRFDFSGSAIGYTKKNIFIFFPLFLSIMNAFSIFMIKSDPRNKNISKVVFNIILLTFPIMSNFLIISTILYSLKYINNFSNILIILVGLLLIALGNYLPKLTTSYTIGIRTPWSLNDEENWIKTHKLGGIIFFISGLLLIILSFIIPKYSMIPLLLLIIPPIYSYILYYKKNKS